MQSGKRSGIDPQGPDVWLLENERPPDARLWVRVLNAMHVSRQKEAARVIWRYRELIDNFQAIELPECKDGRSADA